MSANLIRFLVAGALLVHGIGHTLGFFVPTVSNLLPNTSEQNARTISSIIWTLSAIGFIVAMLGFLGVLVPTEWWRWLAVATAVISMVGLVLFAHNWGALNRYGAWAMNITILLTQLWLRWPPDNMFA